jgi:hypothetical protein
MPNIRFEVMPINMPLLLPANHVSMASLWVEVELILTQLPVGFRQ